MEFSASPGIVENYLRDRKHLHHFGANIWYHMPCIRFYQNWKSFISTLHGMPGRTSNEKAVCPSVCLSNACIVTKRNKRSVQIFIPCKRWFSLVFWEKEWFVGGGYPPTCNFGSTGPHWNEIANFAITPSEKSSINNNNNYNNNSICIAP